MLQTGFVQDSSDILTHEVHTQDSDAGTACVGHCYRCICHDQTVADVNVWPALSGCTQHALNLQQQQQNNTLADTTIAAASEDILQYEVGIAKAEPT